MNSYIERQYCASAYVVDPYTKRILLVKHKKFRKWVQPGGHIEDGETSEEAAIRECFEETHVKIKLLGERFPRETDYIRPLGIQRNRNVEGVEHVDIIYAAIPLRDQEYVMDPNESLDIGWFTRDELDKIECFEDIRITMDYILQHYIH